LGLTQSKKIIQTFPYAVINGKPKNKLRDLMDKKDFDGLLKFLEASKDKSN
jgi:hypothetical protein